MPRTATATKGRILVVDDEDAVRETLEALLTSSGYEVRFAVDADTGLEAMNREECDLALLDVKLPGRSGLAVLQEFRRHNQTLPVIMLTALKDIDIARAAFKNGAQDYIPKPWDADELLAQIARAIERGKLKEENRQLRKALKARYNLASLIGKSAAMQKIFDTTEQIGPARTTVLISGESGTGKEMIAHTLHNLSPRASRNFVPVNSGSMPDDLLESILFGHVKGAFTSAVATKKGLFEVAHEGTIFFDEVGTVGMATQAKLLRVLQEGEFMRLGGNETIQVDVRVVAATNVDLAELVEAGRFREDLFYRLNVINLHMPSLRERWDDIPLLLEHFIAKSCEQNQKPLRRFTESAMQVLLAHRWPGNVRELENVVERAVVLSTGEEMGENELPDELSRSGRLRPNNGNGRSLDQLVGDYERRVILGALDESNGSQTAAAKSLKIPLSTLNQKIKRLGIQAPRRRRGKKRN